MDMRRQTAILADGPRQRRARLSPDNRLQRGRSRAPPRHHGARAAARRFYRAAAKTFAGLSWRWFGVFCLVLLPFALSRPPVAGAILSGATWTGIASAIFIAYLLSFTRFAVALLVFVAAANHAPRGRRRKWAWLAGALVAGSLLGTFATFFLLGPLLLPDSVILRLIVTASPFVGSVRFAGLALTDLVLCTIAATLVYYVKRSATAAAALQREEHEHEEVERENAEARLALLQAQIEPHFLFNTLASIRRLYELDRSRGRAMLDHLASYLTASLPALREARSTVGRELALAVAYLEVQKIRMGKRLAVEVDVPERMHALPLPPMMLATLVENAIIHGLAPMPEGGRLRITARIAGERATIEVHDTGRGLQDAWGVGVGLSNIRARLHSEYGDDAALNLAGGRQGGVVASIDIPIAGEAIAA
jgi:signal transduction histidine kinase